MNSSATQLPALERAVLVTLAYTDQFDHPLRFEEICVRCLRVELTEKKLSKQHFSAALKSIEKLGYVQTTAVNGTAYYFLKGRSRNVQKRLQREKVALQKSLEIDQMLHFATRLPDVEAVFLTGSQAMNSADLPSDIDFMIVTKPNRLWLTRFWVSLFAQFHGKRRSWHNEEAGSWCFNLWLDSKHLRVDASKQDSYRAYEVLQARELWSKNGVGALFKSENDWTTTYFFEGDEERGSAAQDNQRKLNSTLSKSFFGAFSLGWLFDAIDWFAWKFQSFYMKRHQTTERVGRGFAFFHPRDTAKMIKDGWLASLERCLPKEEADAILQPYVRSH